MGLDRYVSFQEGPSPQLEELFPVLEDYLGLSGQAEAKDGSLYGVLAEKGSFPFGRHPRGIDPKTEKMDAFYTASAEFVQSRERWFEVHFDDDEKELCITTRQQDEFTNVVADGFARLCARFWHGILKSDD